MGNKGTIEKDGFAFAYRIEGIGKTVLCIGSERFYPPLFSQAIKEKVQFVFIDHRGFAQQTRTQKATDHTLDQILADTEYIRRKLSLTDFVILGHSGHAFLAFEYAKRYPNHVQKVALLNNSPTNHPKRQEQSRAFFEHTAHPKRKQAFEQDISQLPQDIEKEPHRRFAHLCIRMRAHSFYDYTFDATSLWKDVSLNMPIIDFLWGQAFAECNLRQALSHYQTPTFLGLGKYDYLVGPVSLWEGIDKENPNITKVIFEKSGHYSMLEEPTSFDPIWVEWVYRK